MHARTKLLCYLALNATASALTAESLAAAPRYKMVLDTATPEHGVKVVSLVSNPAIQRGWVALSSVETTVKRVHLSTATEGPQKQVVTGPALIPGQEILRLDAQGNPFYIAFDAATIESTARQFAAQGQHNNSNQGHAGALQGNVIYESWIVSDPANDKSAALGLEPVPAGTWMLSMHVPDEAFWLSEVVTGKTTGFSIEGLFDSEQLNLAAVAAAPVPMKKNWFTALTALLLSFGGDKAATAAEIKVALGIEQLADGRAVSIDDTTGAVTIVGADGQPGAALPDGEYDLQSGGKLVVQDGKRTDAATQPSAANSDAPVAAAQAPDAGSAEPAANVAPLPETAGLPELVAAVNGLIAWAKKDAATEAKEPASSAPAAPKMAAALHGVKLADLGLKLTELKLDAIELTEGEKLNYNAVSRRLTTQDGALVESGYYACADGSYIQVSTDQYIWSIDKQTYDAVYSAKLMAVQLADAKALLAKAPAAQAINLGGEPAADEAALTPAQVRLAAARARQKK